MRRNGDFIIEIRANRIVVAGDIDQVSAEDLERAIRALAGHRIDVDLGAVDRISWPGLRVLLDARVLHPQLRIVAVSEQVELVLASSRTAEYLRGPREDGSPPWTFSRHDVSPVRRLCMQDHVSTVQLDARVFEEGHWVEWFDDVGGRGRVGDSPLTEHGALALLESMHDALAKANFKLERAPDPAMVLVHASVDDVERVTGQRLRRDRNDPGSDALDTDSTRS